MDDMTRRMLRLAGRGSAVVRRAADAAPNGRDRAAAKILLRLMDANPDGDDNLIFRTAKNKKVYPVDPDTGRIAAGAMEGIEVSKPGEKSRKESTEKSSTSSASRGIVYADERITAYLEDPKSLGDTTHREKYEDFLAHGVEVKPLSDGNYLGIPYEEGGGYKIGGAGDGRVFAYHPSKRSHHGGEYYKLASGKTGIKRYNMNGEPIEV